MELLPLITLCPAQIENQARSPPVPLAKLCSALLHRLQWVKELSYHLGCPNIWKSQE